MRIRALSIYVANQLMGTLFQYEAINTELITRLVADDAFARNRNQPVVSLSFLASDPESQTALWELRTNAILNGHYSSRNGYLLPNFFQNLLPEGAFRDQLAELRGCDPKDFFEMLAACGRDLPGDVQALPADLSPEDISRLVAHGGESVDVLIVAEPMAEGVSVSGVQPKLCVLKVGDRYVARTKLGPSRVIAKLPVVGYPMMPEVESLSLQMAKAAGVDTCETALVPLSRLEVEHHYDLGDSDKETMFLAVTRFDRDEARRIHCEDFAQILSAPPENKYMGSYLEIAKVLKGYPSMEEPAVHELLRRIMVNEILGNPDMHLKNIGVLYRDGRTPELSPAYDIVAYSAFNARHGHALHILPSDTPKQRIRVTGPNMSITGKPGLSPMVLREFCRQVGIPEKPAAKVLRETATLAAALWPGMIRAANITSRQKERLLTHVANSPHIQAHVTRAFSPKTPPVR